MIGGWQLLRRGRSWWRERRRGRGPGWRRQWPWWHRRPVWRSATENPPAAPTTCPQPSSRVGSLRFGIRGGAGVFGSHRRELRHRDRAFSAVWSGRWSRPQVAVPFHGVRGRPRLRLREKRRPAQSWPGLIESFLFVFWRLVR